MAKQNDKEAGSQLGIDLAIRPSEAALSRLDPDLSLAFIKARTVPFKTRNAEKQEAKMIQTESRTQEKQEKKEASKNNSQSKQQQAQAPRINIKKPIMADAREQIERVVKETVTASSTAATSSAAPQPSRAAAPQPSQESPRTNASTNTRREICLDDLIDGVWDCISDNMEAVHDCIDRSTKCAEEMYESAVRAAEEITSASSPSEAFKVQEKFAREQADNSLEALSEIVDAVDSCTRNVQDYQKECSDKCVEIAKDLQKNF